MVEPCNCQVFSLCSFFIATRVRQRQLGSSRMTLGVWVDNVVGLIVKEEILAYTQIKWQ